MNKFPNLLIIYTIACNLFISSSSLVSILVSTSDVFVDIEITITDMETVALFSMCSYNFTGILQPVFRWTSVSSEYCEKSIHLNIWSALLMLLPVILHRCWSPVLFLIKIIKWFVKLFDVEVSKTYILLLFPLREKKKFVTVLIFILISFENVTSWINSWFYFYVVSTDDSSSDTQSSSSALVDDILLSVKPRPNNARVA